MEKDYLITKKVEENINKTGQIEKGDIILTALSGGADSVALLTILNTLKEKMGFILEAVHVEHGIRGEESIEDMNYVIALCEKLDIKLYIYRVDATAYSKKEKLTLEEGARILRYNAFYEEVEKQSDRGTVKIAVAHHKNDQAETVLFNMMRGSGLKGVSGIKNIRDNIIRPLLCLSREEIEEYLRIKRISYKIDSTNNDNDYSRNSIRNNIIPELIKIQPRLIDHICYLAGEAAEAEEYFEKEAKSQFQEIVTKREDTYEINNKEFSKLDNIIQRYLVKYILELKYSRWKDISRKHVEDIISLTEKKPGKNINLPNNVIAKRDRDSIVIMSKTEYEKTDCKKGTEDTIYDELVINGEILLDNGIIIKSSILDREKVGDIPNTNYTKWLDYDKISDGLFVRTRQKNDYLCINKDLKNKKLKDYLINEKIPKEIRDNILVIAENNHILWVVGYRISEYYKVTDSTKKVIKIEVLNSDLYETNINPADRV